METKTDVSSKFYNVIILDKSGSMGPIARQAVDGVNETLGSIRSNHRKHPEQEQFVTLVAFCGCELKTLYDRVPIDEARDLDYGDYKPCCMTPLYDAVGSTITRLHELIVDDKQALASVTIITDGYENASREFRRADIAALIKRYTDEGWLFAYIGADHDVLSVASSLSIDNVMQFEKSQQGTRDMFNNFNTARSRWHARMANIMEETQAMPEEEVMRRRREGNRNFFNRED